MAIPQDNITQVLERLDNLLERLDQIQEEVPRCPSMEYAVYKLFSWMYAAERTIFGYISREERFAFRELNADIHGFYVTDSIESLLLKITKNQEYILALRKGIEENPDFFTRLKSKKDKTKTEQDLVGKAKHAKGGIRMPEKKKVFVVHGRNIAIRDAMFEFLRSIGVEPIEWIQAKRLTKKASPYIGEILDTAFSYAQAIIALFTPDDVAMLAEQFQLDNDPEYEKKLTPQARPNVIFETGMAFGFSPERTIIVEFGQLRPFSDVAGRHTIRFDGSEVKRYELVEMLKTAGVSVNIEGKTHWFEVGDFTI